MERQKYQFSWDLLGDLDLGRPNLGRMTRVEVYRLMQFTMREVIERRFGSDVADQIFYDAGFQAGSHFYDHVLKQPTELGEFVGRLQQALAELNIGVLRIEESNPDEGKFVLTVSEDLDCSDLPELDFEVCSYDEGFIAALLQRFTGDRFQVKEVDCWCTGDRTCRFRAEKIAA